MYDVETDKTKESALKFVESSPGAQRKEASVLAGGPGKDSLKRWSLGDKEVSSIWAREGRAGIPPQRRSKEVMTQGGNGDMGDSHLHLLVYSFHPDFHLGYFVSSLSTSLRNVFCEDLVRW